MEKKLQSFKKRTNRGKRPKFLKKRLQKQEEVDLVRRFKLKKQNKKTIKNAMKEGHDNLGNTSQNTTTYCSDGSARGESGNKKSDEIKSSNQTKDFMLDEVKIEIDDVMTNNEITTRYHIEPGEVEIIESAEEMNVCENVQDVRIYNVEGVKILFPLQNQKVSMEGMTLAQCICGSVEINGYKLCETDKNRYSIYSPQSSSLLSMQDCNSQKCSEKHTEIVAKILLEKYPAIEKDHFLDFLGVIKNDLYSCIVFENLNSILPTVLKSLNDYNRFSREGVELSADPKKVCLNTKSWCDVWDAHSICSTNRDCNCIIMVCGGKDVGKSTFCRYAVNRLLQKNSAVYYLDCDCGQTEFTPPGILSVVKVTKPLFGPPFTHLTKPVKSFFYGYLSPGNSPKNYIMLIELLFKFYCNECDQAYPLVVNQQGWVKGLGLSVLADSIRMINPCVIVQINSPTAAKRNPPVDIDEVFLQTQPGWNIPIDNPRTRIHEPKFIKIIGEDYVKENISKKSTIETRNLAITAYFSAMYEQQFALPHHHVPPLLSTLRPFIVKFCDVALHVVHKKVDDDKILLAFNLSIVGLCYVPPENMRRVSVDKLSEEMPRRLSGDAIHDDVECLGLGIVRNIDPVNRLFYILTPEIPEVLNQVNTMMKGNVQPPSSYLLQDPRSNHPYYCHEYVTTSFKGAAVPRPRFNLKRKPSRVKRSFGTCAEG